MSLLALRSVGKFESRGSRRIEVLREVSLDIDAGELVAIWGRRRSGRSTLMRVAAGVERPDTGVVQFEGNDLSVPGSRGLGSGVGYCQLGFSGPAGRAVIDRVRAGLLARNVSGHDASERAHRALERVAVERCGELVMGDLDGAELVRVAIACVLVLGPRVLVIDEPTKGVDLLDRDKILLLLRSIADEGTAILMSDGDGSMLSDADRALTLSGGELRGKRSPAELGKLIQLPVAGAGTAA